MSSKDESIVVYNSDGTVKASVNFIIPGRIDYGRSLAANNSESRVSKTGGRQLVELSDYEGVFNNRPPVSREPRVTREQPTLALKHFMLLVANTVLLIVIMTMLFAWLGSSAGKPVTFEQELQLLYSQGWSGHGKDQGIRIMNKGQMFTYSVDHECLIKVVGDKNFRLRDVNNVPATPVNLGENVKFVERETVRNFTVIATENNTRIAILEKTGGSGDLLKSLTSWINPVIDYLFKLLGTVMLIGLILVAIASIVAELYLIYSVVKKSKPQINTRVVP